MPRRLSGGPSPSMPSSSSGSSLVATGRRSRRQGTTPFRAGAGWIDPHLRVACQWCLKFDRCAQAKNSGVGNAAPGRLERIERAAGGVKDILEIRLNEKAGDNLGLIGKLEGHLIVAVCQGGRRKERRIGVASTRCRRDP